MPCQRWFEQNAKRREKKAHTHSEQQQQKSEKHTAKATKRQQAKAEIEKRYPNILGILISNPLQQHFIIVPNNGKRLKITYGDIFGKKNTSIHQPKTFRMLFNFLLRVRDSSTKRYKNILDRHCVDYICVWCSVFYISCVWCFRGFWISHSYMCFYIV